MLRELIIRNLAIIDDLRISFSEGLTILSGETGAGKSILIQAVNLLLGGRATSELIRTGEESAELEALFEIDPNSKTASILKEFGFENSDELVIRRIISQTDRHRLYINGRISTLSMLNTITENLASISGQHAHQKLLKEEQHLLILDQFGGLIPLRNEVAQVYHELTPLIRKLNELKTSKDHQTQRIEFLEFQKKEIVEVSPMVGEDVSLEQELARLKNSEKLYQTIYEIVDELYSANHAIVERLSEIRKKLEKSSVIDPMLITKAKGVSEATIQLEDVANELRAYLKTIQLDEKRQEAVEYRMHTLQKLKRKYGNGTLEGVLAHLESISQELESLETISYQIHDIETRISQIHSHLVSLVVKLSDQRKQVADILSHKVENELQTLKMSHTKFQVTIQKTLSTSATDNYLTANGYMIQETGIDRVEFLIAPNIGEALKPLASIASGGELSRVVLAIKSILAKTDAVSTIIFDEVDAGIGGGVAELVGKKLYELAKYHQVICITHLGQIAKFGNQHFKIVKEVNKGRTTTSIHLLNQTERIEEIARMIGGQTLTKAAMNHAEEMIKHLSI